MGTLKNKNNLDPLLMENGLMSLVNLLLLPPQGFRNARKIILKSLTYLESERRLRNQIVKPLNKYSC